MAQVILVKVQYAYLLIAFVALITAVGVFLLRSLEQKAPRVMPLFVVALTLGACALLVTAFGSAETLEGGRVPRAHEAAAIIGTAAMIVAIEVALRLFANRSEIKLMLLAVGAVTVLVLLVSLVGGSVATQTVASELVTLVALLAGGWWLTTSESTSLTPHFKRLTSMIVFAYALASLAGIILVLNGHWLNSATAVKITPAIALMLMAKMVLPAAFTALLMLEINAQNVLTLRRRVDTDALTNLTSRGSLNERGESLIQRTRLTGQLVAVLMLDIDYFKKVNDQHGHEIGDHVLEHCASVLRQNLRPEAVIARYGGEEFCAIVPINNEQDSWVVAERLRQAIQSQPFRQKRVVAASGDTRLRPLTLPITISVGGTIAKQGEQLDELLAAADQELYKAKRAGRNRVSLSSHSDAGTPDLLVV